MRRSSQAAVLLFGGVFLLGIGCRAQTQIVETRSLPAAAADLQSEISKPASEAVPANTTPEKSDLAGETDGPVTVKPNQSEPVQSESLADANVEFVRAVQDGDGTWTFHVTVSHPDTGWEDYADGWDVLLPDGAVLKINESDPFTRLLLHPHENEQPFTRSQSGIIIPAGTSSLTVRAHDLIHGFGGKEVRIDLAAETGIDYEIVRP